MGSFPETYNDPNSSPYKWGLSHISYPIPFFTNKRTSLGTYSFHSLTLELSSR